MVLNLARTLPMTQAVAAGDRALALGLTRQQLGTGLSAMEHWPGVRAARRVVGFLDVRAESVGESVSRVRLMEEGLPRPEPQHEIFRPDGRLIARVDFYWDEHKAVGELDGKIKYGRLLKPGQRVEDVIFDEKVREDAVRDLGLQVVRWIWPNLYRTGVLRKRVLRAFARASGRHSASVTLTSHQLQIMRRPSNRCGVAQGAGSHRERFVHLNAATGAQDGTAVSLLRSLAEGFGIDDRVATELGGSAITGTTVRDRRAGAEWIAHVDHRVAKRAEPGHPLLHCRFLSFRGVGHLPAAEQVQEIRHHVLLMFGEWRHLYHVRTEEKSTPMQDNQRHGQ